MSHAALEKIQAIMSQLPLTQGVEGVEQSINKINQVCQEHNYTLPKLFTLILEGVKGNRNDNRQYSIIVFEEALTLCREADIVQRLQVKTLLGSIYADYEEFHKAYDLYREVLENAYYLDANYLSLAYTNISDFYLCLEQYEQAYQIASYGAQYGEKIGHHSNHAICLLNMGYALGHLEGQHQKAILHCKKARDIGATNGATRSEAIANGYIAQIMAKHHQYYRVEEIQYHFSLAAELFVDIYDVHNQTECQVQQIVYLTKTGDYVTALPLALELYQSIRADENYGFFSLLCESLCELLAHAGDQKRLCEIQTAYLQASNKQIEKLQRKEFDNLLNQIEKSTQDHERLVLDKMQQHIGAVTEVGQSIATSENIANNLPLIYEKICSIFPTQEFGIALYHEKADTLEYCYFYDENGPVENFKVDCARQYSVGSYVVKNRRTVHLNRINDEALSVFVPEQERNNKECKHFRNDSPVQSIILTPIMMQNKVLGVLSIQHSLADQYLQYHCSLFEQLASFIAVALENHMQRNRLEIAYQKLETLSKTDPLTGLYNRYQLDDIAPKLIDKAIESDTYLAAAVIDVDYYKGYNDYHGHHQGDIALERIAGEMQKVFDRGTDYLFRYGGDEFLLLSIDSSPEELHQRLLDLQQAIRDLALANPLSICSDLLTLSIGAASLTNLQHATHGFETLFNLADQELYNVKKAGRNAVSNTEHHLSRETILDT
ncbi:sensor domain-containing diguanylate cyclase [Vibrio ponticus]|uniref:diguanylate cyclase n=1 Tax=Vibrio ponticus TaxID=265668 RepID=A0A3N3E5Z3_9VIBR|nr:sensor domain-containing diguanylate cyclase [Vibrio ponticus]ROV62143.1 sensor domain-containing diguanylate cyclase [Vibrio ponticus]